jgi:hypothetical protein
VDSERAFEKVHDKDNPPWLRNRVTAELPLSIKGGVPVVVGFRPVMDKWPKQHWWTGKLFS